jgi:sugar lactone lactonase YvrE
VCRYDPLGRLDREFKLPVANVSRCTFGGPYLDDLYINTGWYGLSNPEHQEQPLAGDLFYLKANIKGLPEEQFKG